MQQFEYKVVPAPRKAERTKGIKRTDDRFAHALTVQMNELAKDGWEYLRSDTLPCEERSGLTSKTTTFQNMLVFRRAVAPVVEAEAKPRLPSPKLFEPANGKAPSLGPATPAEKSGVEKTGDAEKPDFAAE